MSRSFKKNAVIKDKTGHEWYNRKIRRRHNQEVKLIDNLQDLMSYELSNPKILVNGYDICDYKCFLSSNRIVKKFPGNKNEIKFKRKKI